MPTMPGMGLAVTIDVVLRISFVLTTVLLLALTAKRNAALRHAILVAGLAGVFLTPAAMLTLQASPITRWQLDWLGRPGRDDSDAAAQVGSRLPANHITASRNLNSQFPQPSPRVDAKPSNRELDASEASGPWSSEHSPRGLNSLEGRWIAGFLILAWLLGMVVKMTGLGLSLVRLRRIVARARPVTGSHALSLLGLVQGRNSMRRSPRLLESTDVLVPIAAGVVGNYILLPTGWSERLCPEGRMAVLCHECAHLARRDHRVVILQEILASALWFHPLVHLFNRMLNQVREEVCDNHAIAVVNRASYCEALLRLAAGRPGAPPRCATSMWSRRWSLEERVRGILDEERPTRTRISGAARWATVTVTLGMCGLMAMPQLIASQPTDRVAAAPDADVPPQAEARLVTNLMTRTIHKSFPVDGKKGLRLENLAGRVEFVPSEGPAVEIEAIVRVSELSLSLGRVHVGSVDRSQC